MPASVSPALQEFCNKIIERSHGTGAMDRSHGIGAVLIGTADGTPIVNALSPDLDDKDFTDHLERELAQHFALAAMQAEKMGIGGLRYTVTFYPQACLVHVNLAPLVVTLVHRDGDGMNPNYGKTLDMIPELTEALEPLREQVEQAYREDGMGA